MSLNIRVQGIREEDYLRCVEWLQNVLRNPTSEQRQQLQGLKVINVCGEVSSPFVEEEKELPTRALGRENVERVEVGEENLVFDGTIVKLAKTQACIELKNDAKAEEASACRDIKVENCSSLGSLNAGRFIILTKSSVTHANAGEKIVAKDCENVGNLHAAGYVELINCSFGSADAGGYVEADNCKHFEKLSAGEKVEVKNSEGTSVSTGGRVDVRKSKVQILEFSGDSTIANSTVGSIVVHQNRSAAVTAVHKGIVRGPMPPCCTNVYLEDTVVENIKFETGGTVFLRGKSEVTGEVIDGDVIRIR